MKRVTDDVMQFVDDELDDLRGRNLYRPLRELQGPQGARATFDGREVINLSSNNYLGLTNHPRLVRAAVEACTAGLPGNPFGTTRSLGFAVGGPGTLRSQATFGHGGASGTYMWVDPQAAVVVVPLLHGGGTRLKILEAAASARAVAHPPAGGPADELIAELRPLGHLSRGR